jgi:hypothetical protein
MVLHNVGLFGGHCRYPERFEGEKVESRKPKRMPHKDLDNIELFYHYLVHPW